MKKLILGLFFLVGTGTIANAQIIQKSPEKRAEHLTKELQKNLNLTQDQAAKTHDIFLDEATRLDSLINSPDGTPETKKITAKGIRLDSRKQVFSLLNDEQKQKFAAWEKARKEKQKAKRPQNGGAPQQG